MRRFALWVCLAICAAFGAMPALAEEKILSFRSDVVVMANGDFLVTETIKVWAEGREIRRGIYRDFPTGFVDGDGKMAKNGFELLSARRDGHDETARVEDGGNFVRVYLGQADVYLADGDYSYELTYKTDRQVRFFPDHDEIYWNATGTVWNFPIENAIAVIHLPEGARAGETAVYTGMQWSRAQNATVTVSGDGREVSFVTQQALRPHEGLTVLVSLAKGGIAPPTEAQKFAWFLRDHLATLIASVGTFLVLLYYASTWVHVGRDPAKGVVVPRWDVPQGVSPALAHYIWNRGFRDAGYPAISASALNLAVGGYVALENIGATLALRTTGKVAEGGGLAVGEATLLERIRTSGGQFEISTSNGPAVATLGERFRQAMEREHREVYYHHNRGWIFLGAVFSLVVLGLSLFFWTPNGQALALLMPILITGAILTVAAVQLAKQWGKGLAGKIKVAVIGFGVLVIAINSGLASAARIFPALEDPLFIGALASLILLNLLFFVLLGAPTPLGQKRTDEIDGLRHYLSVAEEDRMNMAGAPRMSPQHFETLLPYAVALDLEKPWTRAFETWFAAAVAAGTVQSNSYHPRWYQGRDGNSGGFGDKMAQIGGKLSQSMTSALPAPKSSSSGFSSGGGSSGGGGGGGGGGGW